MGKQANKLTNNQTLKTLLLRYTLTLLFLFFNLYTALSQTLPFSNGKTYTIADITVKGNTAFSAQTIIAYSGLSKGKEVMIPGEDISNAIKKLWKSNLFSDIEVYLLKTEGNAAYLQIQLSDLPELNDVKITGVKKGKKESIKTDNKLEKGAKVTENLITTTKNYLTNKYKKEGYFNTKVNINTIPVQDSLQKQRVNMVVAIDKGTKVKVKNINFKGNTIYGDKKLKKAMKKTKQQKLTRLFKRSKYIAADYKEDLNSVIDMYKENGYRDARIISDSLVNNGDNTISLNINVEEGNKYTFGDISFIGNTVYSDKQLARILGIEKGDTYNGVLLQERIADNTRPDANDITNLYQNNGYLFSTINPVEVNAEGNIIDIEVRISEGKPVYLNRVTVTGNDRTNDHVIYRELRTRPGQLYSKANIVRSIREIGQLGVFDAQQIAPNIKNPNPEEGTVDVEYSVVESGSSQIQLQGGYGGGGFIGTLALSFNNFAIKDLFKKDAYKPVPMGDGQSFSLQAQRSRFFQVYSLSFSEPWLGGKKPVQFSSSISYNKSYNRSDNDFREINRDSYFNTLGISVGLAKRLSAPDDYFTLSQGISYQHYDIRNFYRYGLFEFKTGNANNIAYSIGLSRNNTYNDPIYPTGGSNFVISGKLTPPYSLFSSTNYEELAQERLELEEKRNTSTSLITKSNIAERIGEIDKQRFKWLEFYKIKFRGDWYAELAKNLVLRPSVEFGFLGAYNNDIGVIPFERFELGGSGLVGYNLNSVEAVALRGYPDRSLSPSEGSSIYNKFSLELRYPVSLKASAKIFALSFLEAGKAYSNFKEFSPFNSKRSAGVGVRIFMPAFGLLGIDHAYGFDNALGKTQNHGWETHFIIGQQF